MTPQEPTPLGPTHRAALADLMVAAMQGKAEAVQTLADAAKVAASVFHDGRVERTEQDVTTYGSSERALLWTDWLIVRVPVAWGERREPFPWPDHSQ